LAVFVTLFPVAWLVSAGFKTSAEIAVHPERFIPTNPTLDNARRALGETAFVRGMLNSLLVAIPATGLAVLLSVFTAYLTVRLRFPGHDLVDRFSLAAYLVPGVVLALPLFILFSRLRVGGSLAALGIAHLLYLFPLSYWLVRSRMQELPRSLEEGLMLDGADLKDLLRFVWLPSLRLHLFSVAVIVFTISMNDYVLARFLLVDGSRTLPLVLQDIFDLSSKDWGLICGAGAAAVGLLSIPLLILMAATGQYHMGGRRG
jgi:multiple sugar transport system permease protein